MMKKNYHKELTLRELELLLDVVKPLQLKLSTENRKILKQATNKLQKIFDEQNPKTKPTGPARKHENRSEIERISALGPVDWLHGRRGKETH